MYVIDVETVAIFGYLMFGIIFPVALLVACYGLFWLATEAKRPALAAVGLWLLFIGFVFAAAVAVSNRGGA